MTTSQVGEDEEPSIFWRRERTVLVHREPACGPRFPIEVPRGEMHVERRLEGDQLLKLVERHAGQIQELCGAGLHNGIKSAIQRTGLEDFTQQQTALAREEPSLVTFIASDFRHRQKA